MSSIKKMRTFGRGAEELTLSRTDGGSGGSEVAPIPALENMRNRNEANAAATPPPIINTGVPATVVPI
jgi:hypothetical protein